MRPDTASPQIADLGVKVGDWRYAQHVIVYKKSLMKFGSRRSMRFTKSIRSIIKTTARSLSSSTAPLEWCYPVPSVFYNVWNLNSTFQKWGTYLISVVEMAVGSIHLINLPPNGLSPAQS